MPTAMMTSPRSKISPGVGEGMISVPRAIATIDELDRARHRVAHGPADELGVERQRDLLGEEAGNLVAQAREPADRDRRAEELGDRGGLVVGERDRVGARVGVVNVEERQVTLTRALGDDAHAAAALRDDVGAHTDPGEVYPLDPDTHAAST